ncbi:MAG: hypothetical protein LBC35_01295 [Coriobacteriales bacterium]|jgi:hypothetical protein|nr:hypothetical protein [Coriobacteriales bacterium]
MIKQEIKKAPYVACAAPTASHPTCAAPTARQLVEVDNATGGTETHPTRIATRRAFLARKCNSKRRAFIASDGGFTSVGVAVALLLVITLLFSAAQVRWVQSQSADIQFVADSAALAGGNVVGEYTVIVRIADAVVLSMSLFGLVVFGVAIVVSCIPYMQEVGLKLMEFGKKVFEARDKFSEGAQSALNNLQKALPFIAAVNSAVVIEGNSTISGSRADYRGLAMLMPLTGEDVSFADDDEAQSSGDMIGEHNQNTAAATDEAQRAYEDMQSSKLEGYLADCGNNPAYCLYERANRLAGMSGGQNPYFSSVDSWLFDYAFLRAKTYYSRRLAQERPLDSSLAEQVKSFCRARYYHYAVQQMDSGWCRTAADGSLDAYFPLMPKNNEELRKTSLYTERVYPVCQNGLIHGSTSCSAYISAGPAGFASVADLEAGTYQQCPDCGFDINSIGRVASASTAVDNGFEYHYRRVASAAERYQAAARRYQESSGEAKESTQHSLDEFEQAIVSLKSKRLLPKPPGRNGVLAVVIDYSVQPVPTGFANSSVTGDAQLNPRLAVSACALEQEKATHDSNVLASFADRAKAESRDGSLTNSALGAFDGILSVWSSVLMAYTDGGEAIGNGLSDFLDSIPLVKSTPLSRWAKGALTESIQAVGLQGADLSIPTPMLVNTLHVLRASDSAPARGLLKVKETYSAYSGQGSTSLGFGILDGLFSQLKGGLGQALEGEVVLFEISFGDYPGLPSIPITLSLPAELSERASTFIDEAAQNVGSRVFGGDSNAVWE